MTKYVWQRTFARLGEDLNCLFCQNFRTSRVNIAQMVFLTHGVPHHLSILAELNSTEVYNVDKGGTYTDLHDKTTI